MHIALLYDDVFKISAFCDEKLAFEISEISNIVTCMFNTVDSTIMHVLGV